MLCKSCGNNLERDSKFCPECGEPINDLNTLEQSLKIENENKKLKLILIGIISIFVIGGILILGQFFSNKVLDKSQNEIVNEADYKNSSKKLNEEEVIADIEPVELIINQLDTSRYPEIAVYFSALNSKGISVSNLTAEGVDIYEGNENNKSVLNDISNVSVKSLRNMPISVSLILDNSESMDGYSMEQAKSSARDFFNYVDFNNKDKVEVIEFNSDVYVRLPYCNDISLLNTAIDTIETEGNTALYDALYTGLVRAYSQYGPKCILAFTDGEENASTYSLNEVINLSKETAIPIYIIGVGNQINESALKSIADNTGGAYYYAPTPIELEMIYKNVYENQKKQYVLTYNSKDNNSANDWRTITLKVKNNIYDGQVSREYILTPNNDLPIELLFSSITASSILAPQKDPQTDMRFDYLPYHAIDKNPSTAWVESAQGDGIGEWIKIDFLRSATVSGMYIKNGYFRTEDRLVQNNRVKRLKVHFSDGTNEVFDLPDPINENFNQMTNGQGYKINFSKKIITSYVKVEILEVYKGTKWKDTCISDILLFN